MTTTPISRRTRPVAALAAVMLLATGCGSSPNSESSSGSTSDAVDVESDGALDEGDASSSAASASAGTPICDLLSPEFITSLFKEDVQPENDRDDEIDPLETGECEWRASADDEATTDFYFVSVATYASGEMASLLENFGGEPVEGIGDEAFTDVVDALWVRQGTTEFNVFLRQSFGADVTDAERLDTLTAAANEVLANL